MTCLNIRGKKYKKRGTWIKGCYKNTELQIVKFFNGGVRGYGVYLSWRLLKGGLTKKCRPTIRQKVGGVRNHTKKLACFYLA